MPGSSDLSLRPLRPRSGLSGTLVAAMPVARIPDGRICRPPICGARTTVYAFHAIPVTIWDTVQTDAMGVIWRVTCITEEQDLLFIGGATDGTRDSIFFHLIVNPCSGIKFGDLLFVLYCTGR
jgi:hypothetical protein